MKCYICKELIKPQVVKAQMYGFGMSSTPTGKGEWVKEQWEQNQQETFDILQDPEHFTLSLSSASTKKLFFHKDCFEGSAGDEFTEKIENSSRLCLMCLENVPRIEKFTKCSARGNICDDCAAIAPMCDACKVQMTLKYSPKNKNVFWSCVKYPSCKNAKSV